MSLGSAAEKNNLRLNLVADRLLQLDAPRNMVRISGASGARCPRPGSGETNACVEAIKPRCPV